MKAIQNIFHSIYNDVMNWKKNIFSVPRGNTGNKFIAELTRIINLFVYIIASIGVLFMKNSKSNYLKRQIGPSPKDEVLFSFK